jgi:hypothetical protein
MEYSDYNDMETYQSVNFDYGMAFHSIVFEEYLTDYGVTQEVTWLVCPKSGDFMAVYERCEEFPEPSYNRWEEWLKLRRTYR